jgi:hypothetical protein
MTDGSLISAWENAVDERCREESAEERLRLWEKKKSGIALVYGILSSSL